MTAAEITQSLCDYYGICEEITEKDCCEEVGT
jgi:hypothetical protein